MKKSTKNIVYLIIIVGLISSMGSTILPNEEQPRVRNTQIFPLVAANEPDFTITPTIGLRYKFEYTYPTMFNLNYIRWDFGDGSVEILGDESNPIYHTFPNSGIYEVKLTVKYAGDSEEYQRKYTITVDENPDIEFEVFHEGGFEYYFQSNIPYPENIEYLKWEFGDGSLIENDYSWPIYHTYSGEGKYLVTLTVKYVGDPEFHTVTHEVVIGDSSTGGVIDPNTMGDPLSFIPGYPIGLLTLILVTGVALIFKKIQKMK